jgi:thiol-disulfide isomerase/thioredoxin
MEPAKRQRVSAPEAKAPSNSPPAPPEKNTFNGPCCGGVKAAGTGPGYKLVDAVHIGIARRTKACWMNDETKLVATKCGKCKKIIFPTTKQLARMKRFNISVHDEVQLREVEQATGCSPQEALDLFKA